MTPPAARPVLVLVRDMIFSTKITSTAKALNVDWRLMTVTSRLLDAQGLPKEPGCALIVDLNLDGAAAAAGAWRGATGLPVVGFVSHVDTAVIQQSRQAGVDRIMARSQFVQVLPQLLVELSSPREERPLS